MLDSFIEAVDLRKSRIINHPRYLFLCGGPLSDAIDSPVKPPPSLRQYLRHALQERDPSLVSSIVIAEDVFDRFDKDHYGDLLSFEQDLAYFCSVIVLILESPGAIAELGSFVLLDQVITKLYAILDDSHYNAKSFIRLGPVEYLKRREEERVLSHNWLTSNRRRPALPKLRCFEKDLIDDILRIHQLHSATHSIDPSNRSHYMLMLAGLIRVAQPLLFSELLNFLSVSDLNFSTRDLHQFLSILQSFGIVKKHRYGGTDYYWLSKDIDPIAWAYKPMVRNKSIARWITDFNSHYRNNEVRRIGALKSARHAK